MGTNSVLLKQGRAAQQFCHIPIVKVCLSPLSAQSTQYGGFMLIPLHIWPASLAQLEARPTGDQEVAGLTSAKSATFFR